ncbi:MAG: hypothetical protein KAG61_10920 [Bacteriovoracaceae bacterium]|nr:hypothetical protein [Bacteriovoracaceae bacterium]
MKVQLNIDFEASVEKALKNIVQDFVDFRVRSKSLDARGINRGKRPKYNYTVEVIRAGEKFEFPDDEIKEVSPLQSKPIIVGAGPSGLFCALRLLDYGIPSIIIERGKAASERMRDISKYWRYGTLNPESNVCFGEGGAGLFSDGKLVTRVKSPFIGYVMRRLVDFGADVDTAYLSNPHLGSDRLRKIITLLSSYLKDNGCEVHYQSRVKELLFSDDKSQVIGVKTADDSQFKSNHVVLATGHSAHEMYEYLLEQGVELKQKDFAVGVRVEHPRSTIDCSQFGKFAGNESLGSARYRLSYNNENSERGTYSFCMCPGGYVLSTSTIEDGIVTNGMSNYKQNSKWSNSAMIVTVKAGKDFPSDDILAGLKFQTEIEKKAFEVSKRVATGRELPADTIGNFVEGIVSSDPLPVSSSPSHVVRADMTEILPPFIITELKKAFRHFDQKIDGFISQDALLIGPETRTSSPITIVRDKDTFESVGVRGLYPCGEGAGYAGGITSSAVDGVNVAMSIMRNEGRIEKV